MRTLTFPLLLVLWIATSSLAQQPCVQAGGLNAVKQVKAAQAQLLAYKVNDGMDALVPPSLQAQLRDFKDALAAFADTVFACTPASADATTLQTAMAAALDANHPFVQGVYDPKKPPQLDQIYGADLNVKVTAPANIPQLRLVEFNFGIICGADSILLAYEHSNAGWTKSLRWQSPDYNEVLGAFGDSFQYQVFQPANSPSWLLATFHGAPWCTSRWSGFTLDLLQPAHDAVPQNVVMHRHDEYVRDTDPVLKLSPGGFQLRVETGSLDMDIMTRPAIYRFRVASGKDSQFQIQRIQPIAMNGRDFVDEWLQAPWNESAQWSAPSGLTTLQQEYKEIAAIHDPNTPDGPSLTYGPVRSCSDSASHFQVELDQTRYINQTPVAQKPVAGKPTYFQIQEGTNSFTMLSASPASDPHCTGPDIMVKH